MVGCAFQRWPTGGAAVCAVLLLSSCSLLYDPDNLKCDTDADCDEGQICKNEFCAPGSPSPPGRGGEGGEVAEGGEIIGEGGEGAEGGGVGEGEGGAGALPPVVAAVEGTGPVVPINPRPQELAIWEDHATDRKAAQKRVSSAVPALIVRGQNLQEVKKVELRGKTGQGTHEMTIEEAEMKSLKLRWPATLTAGGFFTLMLASAAGDTQAEVFFLQGEPGPPADPAEVAAALKADQEFVAATTGASGEQGPPGRDGKEGPEGPKGNPGDPGASVVGSSIAPGDPNCPFGGAKYTVGTSTTYVCNAEPGAQGLTGPTGQTGQTGTPGPKGDPGAKGDPGPAGAQGAKGDPGAACQSTDVATVLKADPSFVASTTGPTGPQGPKGNTGDTGSQGPSGSTGPRGYSCWDLNANGACDLASEDTSGDGACTVADCKGPQGVQGTQGPQGDPGDSFFTCIGDDCSTAKNITVPELTVTTAYDLPDCPEDYLAVSDASIPATGFYCRRGADDLVKVGGFWIDRYEALVVSEAYYNGGQCDGTCTEGTTCFGSAGGASPSDNYGAAFPDPGNWTAKRYACSRAGVMPSRMLTWFQAQQACALSGKDLCTNDEWQAAAAGTPDVNLVDCNINTSAPSNTGAYTACKSVFGAFDLIGNLWEWAAWWGQAGRDMGITQGASASPWPAGYGGDYTWNINGEAANPGWITGAPAAALRGGTWNNGAAAGVFAVALDTGPSSWDSYARVPLLPQEII